MERFFQARIESFGQTYLSFKLRQTKSLNHFLNFTIHRFKSNRAMDCKLLILINLSQDNYYRHVSQLTTEKKKLKFLCKTK